MGLVDAEDSVGGSRRRVISLLAEALLPLASASDRALGARRIVDLLAGTVARACQIDLVDENGALATLARSPAEEGPGYSAAAEAAEEVARSGTAQVVQAAAESPVWAVLPLTVRRRRVGVLSVALDHRSSGVDDAEMADLGRIAVSVGAALAHAEAYERAFRVSHTLQESLLPSAVPTAGWFEMAGRYVPGTTGLDIGGDWYDAEILDDGTLALSVGDVAGHGIEAAAQMGELRSAIMALRRVQSGPDTLLSVLHGVGATMGCVATAVSVRVDRSGEMRWSSAGHLPPLLVRPDGDVEILPGEQAPLLGVGYTGAVPLNRWHLEEGETVVLYTDGLVERRDEGLDESLERLTEELAQMSWRTPSDLIERMLQGRDVSASTEDDIAVLVTRLRADPGV